MLSKNKDILSFIGEMGLVIILFVLVLFYFLTPCRGATVLMPNSKSIYPVPEAFYSALHQQEASGVLNPKDGDGGKAIGPFQIWRVYWKDAVEFDKSIGGTYQDCRDMAYARKVVRAYLNRHCRGAVVSSNYEIMARCHNSGPQWAKKWNLTHKYWEKFKQRLR